MPRRQSNFSPFVLHWPLGGMQRRSSYRQTPPYTSRDLQNVRGDDTMKLLSRGGRRRGLDKYSYDQLGSGSPVRGLSYVVTADDSTNSLTFFGDSFQRNGSTLAGAWSTSAWCSDQPGTAEEWSGISTSKVSAAGVLDAVSISTGSIYNISLDIAPDMITQATWAGGTFQARMHGTWYIFARMDDSSPDVFTEGIIAMLTIADDANATYKGALVEFNGGIPTPYAFSGGTLGGHTPVTFRVEINSDTVTCYLGGTTLVTQAVTSHSGSRVGFGVAPDNEDDGCFVDNFKLYGTPSTATEKENIRTYPVALSSTSGYVMKTPREWTAISGLTLSSGNHTVMMTRYAQKLYIADYNTSGTGVVYEYNPKDDSIAALSATKGAVPTNCDVIGTYLGRLLLCKDNLWHMSKIGDIQDWDYTASGVDRAVSGQASDAYQIAEPLTAAIPFSDDILIFSGPNNMFVLRGDPSAGGRIDNLSYEVGIIDRFAYCIGSDGEIYFLSRDGLYLLEPGALGSPRSISRQKLPTELRNINTSAYEVSLVWNQDERGVNIYSTPLLDRDTNHWFYSAEYGAFYRDVYARSHSPYCAMSYKTPLEDESGVLLGCHDGYVRTYSDIAQNDDSETITSYVDYGPFMIANADHFRGMIGELYGVLAAGSADVTVEVFVSDAAETIDTDTNSWSGEWSGDGLQIAHHPRIEGAAAIIRVGSTEDGTWAVEKIFGDIYYTGRQAPRD